MATTLAGNGKPVTIKDEGVTLLKGVSVIDLVGAGVTGTVSGSTVTMTIPGGGSISIETPTGTIDGANKDFSVANSPLMVFKNGQLQSETDDYTISGTYTISFVIAPEVDSILKTVY